LILISDSRFTTQIEEECPGLKFEIKSDSGGTLKSAAAVLKSLKVTSIAIEAQSVSKAAFDDWQTLFSGVELVSTGGLVESLRAIKDPVELALIRKSIEINERVFQIMRDRLSGQQTEREIGHQLENDMRRFGASGVSFPPIVGVGPRSALPHATLTDQQVSSSPFMLVDWGTRYEGYASDLTRIVITGKVPAKFRKIYDVVRDAQQGAIQAIGPGVDCQHVDRIAREFIAKAGFGNYFGHGLGHSFGLQVHESPSFSPTRRGTLESGMVVTIEPGIYLPGFGGVRIEDDILVTKDGFEVLSSLPTDFESAHVTLMD
jgi:Xaa-Pro aminopeptidase